VGYFLYAGGSTMHLAWKNGNVPLMSTMAVGMTFLSLYHTLLGLGLWKSLKEDGKIPERAWKD